MVAIINSLLLALSLYLFEQISGRKIHSIGFFYLSLLGILPIFNHLYDLKMLFFALSTICLFIAYLKTKFKIFLTLTVALLITGSFYGNEIIKFPFKFQYERLIFFDRWTNQAIAQMRTEALYLPRLFRPLVFNPLVYLYLIASKISEMFMLKNLYDTLLFANLYPLFTGIVLDFKSWDMKKFLIPVGLLLVSLSSVLSNGVDIFNTFILMSPLLLYFILLGFGKINKRLYLLLLIFSLILNII